MNKNESPYVAARDSLITVSLGVNSAGIEAALYGKRSIYWSHNGLICNQLTSSNSLKLVYYDLDDMIKDLNSYILDQNKSNNLGDHSSIIDQIDRFRDGMAGKRTGIFIKNFILSSEIASDKTDILDKCMLEYENNWGIGTVTKLMN